MAPLMLQFAMLFSLRRGERNAGCARGRSPHGKGLPQQWQQLVVVRQVLRAKDEAENKIIGTAGCVSGSVDGTAGGAAVVLASLRSPQRALGVECHARRPAGNRIERETVM